MNPKYKSRFRTGILLRFPVGLPQRDHNSQATTSLAHGRLSIGLAPMEAATDLLTIQTRQTRGHSQYSSAQMLRIDLGTLFAPSGAIRVGRNEKGNEKGGNEKK